MPFEEYTFPKSRTKTFIRKTLSNFQRIILYILVSLPILGTPAIILLLSGKEISQGLLITLAILPTPIAFIGMFYLALNPKGPEKEFKLEEFSGIDADTHFSVVSGRILTKSAGEVSVKVVTPTVFGPSANLMNDSLPDQNQHVAFEETVDWALDILADQYPGAKWREIPEVTEASKEISDKARGGL